MKTRTNTKNTAMCEEFTRIIKENEEHLTCEVRAYFQDENSSIDELMERFMREPNAAKKIIDIIYAGLVCKWLYATAEERVEIELDLQALSELE
jgi:hypothetical protein